MVYWKKLLKGTNRWPGLKIFHPVSPRTTSRCGLARTRSRLQQRPCSRRGRWYSSQVARWSMVASDELGMARLFIMSSFALSSNADVQGETDCYGNIQRVCSGRSMHLCGSFHDCSLYECPGVRSSSSVLSGTFSMSSNALHALLTGHSLSWTLAEIIWPRLLRVMHIGSSLADHLVRASLASIPDQPPCAFV